MRTCIIPCAGKSTRYKLEKPKWLLTYPNGELMIQMALKSINTKLFKKIVFVITKEQAKKFNADLILSQAFNSIKKKLLIVILESDTNGPAETVVKAIIANNIKGEVLIKDSDNYVNFNMPKSFNNFIVGSDLNSLGNISHVNAKSFLNINKNDQIVDIAEKKVVSDTISLGVYGFSSADELISSYLKITSDKRFNGEIYLSHLISDLILSNKAIFKYIKSTSFEDWGTKDDWELIRHKHKTIFCDIDGVLLKNTGKYGKVTWNNKPEPIKENLELIKNIVLNGGQLILTTSRPSKYKNTILKIMKLLGIKYHTIIFNLNHSERIIINDFAPTNAYPTCSAINIPRDSLLKDYIKL